MARDVVKEALRAREGGRVERCHCIPHHGSYSVAAHTFQMLTLLDMLHPDPPLRLYRAILQHDLHERVTGDIPGCATRIYGTLCNTVHAIEGEVRRKLGYTAGETLTPDETMWLKTLDKIELLLWCDDEENAGNRHAYRVRQDVVNWFGENAHSLPIECNIFLDNWRWDRTIELGWDK